MTPARRDGLVLAAILGLAGVLRFVGLPGRGEWDDDQGNQLLTLLEWVRDGQVPLVGPLGSFGTAHHGVAYYWILAPGAFLTDTHPVAAVATLALVGIAGVAATWWLGRTVGGPLAGHVAALLMAVSPSGIITSTFVWNSNIVGSAAALAFAAGWHAWRTRRGRWWLLAAVGTVLMLHGHLLAAVGVPPLIALLTADVFRRPRAEKRQMLWPVVGVAAIVVAGHVPLLVHEFSSGFSETRAIVDYVSDPRGGGLPPPTFLPIVALTVIGWRILAWPVAGLVTSAPLLGLAATIITAAALAVAAAGKRGIARDFGRWAAATTLWAVVMLTLVSPSLAVSFPGLPNDQYHAWLDPILFAVIGVAVARLWASSTQLGRTVGATVVVACTALSLAVMPAMSSPGGGWPRMAEAAVRIRAVTGDRPTAITGVAKTGGAVEFPLRRQHTPVVEQSAAEFLVVTCDTLFERGVGLPCNGPAEEARAQAAGFPPRLVDRFATGPRLIISVFAKG